MPMSRASTAAQRIAWLLRTTRLFGPEERWVTAAEFALALPGPQSRGVGPSQITRWERAVQAPDYSTIRQYEDLLGLPRHRLVAVADMVTRELDGSCGRSALRRPRPDPIRLRRETYELLDQALGGDLMDGLAWDHLTTNLWELADVYLYPASLWQDIAWRLLAEMVISEGAQWLRRGEALSRLLGHPHGELPTIAACAAMAADPRSQVVIEPLMALESSAHPDASARVLQQIQRPTSERTLVGAWWSAAEKLEHGHFTPRQRDQLVREASKVARADGHLCLAPALEVLRQTPRTSGVERLLRLRPSAPNNGAETPTVRQDHLVERVYSATVSRMPRDVLPDDPVLRQMLAEMLFHPQISRRFVASNLLQASPYRHRVAQALVGELRRARMFADGDLAPVLIATAGDLGGPDIRVFLERIALSTGIPDANVHAALRGLAHCDGHSSDAFWKAAIAAHRLSESKIRSIVYALGVARHRPLLTRERDHGLPSARTAVVWWLDLPQHVADSTSRSHESPLD